MFFAKDYHLRNMDSRFCSTTVAQKKTNLGKVEKTTRAERAHHESVFVYHVYIVDDHYTIGVLEKPHSGWSYHIVRPNSSSLSLCIIISSCIPFLVAGSYPRTYLLNMLIYCDYHFLWQVDLLLDSQPSNLFNKNLGQVVCSSFWKTPRCYIFFEDMTTVVRTVEIHESDRFSAFKGWSLFLINCHPKTTKHGVLIKVGANKNNKNMTCKGRIETIESRSACF